VHEQPGDEKGRSRLDSTCIHNQPPLVQPHLLQQAQPVDHAVSNSRVVSIPYQIVHAVHIYLSAHYLSKARSVYRRLNFAREKAAALQGPIELALPEDVHDVLVLLPEIRGQGGFCGMGEGAMAHIVQKRSSTDQPPVVLIQPQIFGKTSGQVIGPKAVLEAGMVGPGIDQTGQTELLDPAQPLHLGCVRHLLGILLQPDIAVHRISDFGHQRVQRPHALKMCGNIYISG